MNWQPIETAPRDGTPVLVWDKKPFWGWGDNTKPMALVARWSCDTRAAWESVACVDGVWSAAEPTHWMPLPDPPSNITTKDNDSCGVS